MYIFKLELNIWTDVGLYDFANIQTKGKKWVFKKTTKFWDQAQNKWCVQC